MKIENLIIPREKFDELEVHPCRTIKEEGIPKKLECVEQCEPSEAEFWSVYTHLVGGGLDCIGDFDTKEEADNFVKFLKEFVQKSKMKFLFF